MKPAIIDRGRGPEIAGSRITVFDVLAETRAGATPADMAGWYNLEIPQIEFALAYIEEHREEVERDYQRIKERHARGNSPEIRAKIEESRKRLAERWPQFRARPASHEENGDGRHSAGH